MNICIFPGTFNPIHIAHIKMAEFALLKFNFDRIIFIPSYIPPQKNISKTLANHRLNMVKIATQSNPKFEVSDIEYKSEGKSYSFITVQKIKEQYKISGRLNFIIGTDAFKNIMTWYKIDELKNMVHFIIFQRGDDIINKSDFKDFSYEFAEMDKIDISSTEFRNEHKNVTLKVVKDYIEKNGLYT